MTNLVLNAANVCILKNDADFFDAFGKIVINTANAAFSRDAYAELSKRGLVVNAANVDIIDIIGEPINIGDAVIGANADYSGKFLVGGWVQVTDGAALGGVTGIFAQGVFAPEGTRFDFNVSAKIYYYPAGAAVVRGDVELDEGYAAKLDDNAILWTLGRAVALSEKAAADVSARGITISSRHLLINESAERQYGKCFKADSREVIPDGCEYVHGDVTLSALNAGLYGDKLYIAGDLTVKPDAADALAGFGKIIVTGSAVIPHAAAAAWKAAGRAAKVTPYKGELWMVNGTTVIKHEQLESANADGMKFTLIANGFLRFDADVTKNDLDCLAAVYYNGAVVLPADAIPSFNAKVVEGNGVAAPLPTSETGDIVNDVLSEVIGGGNKDDNAQVINVANFVRI